MKKRQHQALQIALDGPAGAGKSTVAKIVANRLQLFYVDTGAMYRAIAYKALKKGASMDDEATVSQIAKRTEVVLDHSEARRIWCDGEDVTQEIRCPEVSRAVPVVAAYPKIRERLVELQRMEAKRGGVVMDGRDIGTHVLPEADLKIFLTATPEERAKRRWIELKKAGKDISFQEVAQDMIQRDRVDTEREVSPLKPAKDAIILDTTGLSVEELVAKILVLAEEVIKDDTI
ncbi:(d)CMP kinase [Desulfosporosinus sp.]|uniref:(d)CMP kinase n=1 Tax=Desulfosporosinus sp. TaxID=157907 RepID=UPI000E90E167|nr:(d)CMP kinase [Desulfosporosinus sp.]MBC2721663.1 (d)CMP kinase [Desulfosporosinus sp.]MBC2725961.1 (d)CMP kinase [Desulfosporosinus sp.]HBV89218.1 (d)CMP kinase [Desulfosporosinus sp.]